MPKEAVPTQTSWDELSQRNFSPMPDGVTRRARNCQDLEAAAERSRILSPAPSIGRGGRRKRRVLIRSQVQGRALPCSCSAARGWGAAAKRRPAPGATPGPDQRGRGYGKVPPARPRSRAGGSSYARTEPSLATNGFLSPSHDRASSLPAVPRLRRSPGTKGRHPQRSRSRRSPIPSAPPTRAGTEPRPRPPHGTGGAPSAPQARDGSARARPGGAERDAEPRGCGRRRKGRREGLHLPAAVLTPRSPWSRAGAASPCWGWGWGGRCGRRSTRPRPGTVPGTRVSRRGSAAAGPRRRRARRPRCQPWCRPWNWPRRTSPAWA